MFVNSNSQQHLDHFILDIDLNLDMGRWLYTFLWLHYLFKLANICFLNYLVKLSRLYPFLIFRSRDIADYFPRRKRK